MTKAAGRSLLTVTVAALAGATVVFGVGVLNDRAEAVPEPEAAQPVPVAVEPVHYEETFTRHRQFIGQIEPSATLSLSFELAGRIDAMSADEGDWIEAGAEIARLDTDLLQAEAARLKAARSALAAQLAFAESRLQRAVKLQKQGFSSTETLDQSLSARDELLNRVAETDAALHSVTINIEKSVLRAPLSGRVAAQGAEASETVRAGQEIVSLMATDQPEFRVGLPLDIDAARLAEVDLDVAGKVLSARLKALRPDVDPVTRTRTALFEVEPAEAVLFGQTAVLKFPTEIRARGVWLPVDALQSGNGSVWTVLIVIDGAVATAAVEILHVENARAFVTGTLQEADQVVISGAHRVVAGQRVRVVTSGD